MLHSRYTVRLDIRPERCDWLGAGSGVQSRWANDMALVHSSLSVFILHNSCLSFFLVSRSSSSYSIGHQHEQSPIHMMMKVQPPLTTPESGELLMDPADRRRSGERSLQYLRPRHTLTIVTPQAHWAWGRERLEDHQPPTEFQRLPEGVCLTLSECDTGVADWNLQLVCCITTET
jgi:hypothetical protein